MRFRGGRWTMGVDLLPTLTVEWSHSLDGLGAALDMALFERKRPIFAVRVSWLCWWGAAFWWGWR